MNPAPDATVSERALRQQWRPPIDARVLAAAGETVLTEEMLARFASRAAA